MLFYDILPDCVGFIETFLRFLDYMLLRLLLYFISTFIILLNIVEANDLSSKCKNTQTQQCNVPVADEPAETSSWWLADTYDAAQEQVFRRLQAEFEQDP